MRGMPGEAGMHGGPADMRGCTGGEAMTLEEIRGMLEKATKGPWKADTTFAALEGIIIRPGSTGYGLATIWPRDVDSHVDFHVDDYEYGGGSPVDNAALIAAAPELAALLVRAVEALEDQIERDGICLVDPPCGDCAACRSRSLLRELGVEA